MSLIKHILIVILLITNLTSCTSLLWRNSVYGDGFKHFLITQDGKKIVILGEKYHYVFDDESGVLSKLLSWEGRSKLEMEIYNFRLSKFNNITGSITVKSRIQKNSTTELSEQEKDFLIKDGFTIATSDEYIFTNTTSDEVIFKKKINIAGVRYLPKPGVNYDTSSSFTKVYGVNIERDDFSDKATKIAFTPVTVVGDGVLIIAAVALETMSITIRMIYCPANGLKLKNCL